MKELRELILWHLDVFLHETAAFLAERLCASCPTDENFELLGLCYLRTAGVDGGPGARNTQSGARSAYAVLQGKASPQCRYLLAVACLRLERWQEAERALLADTEVQEKGLTACQASLISHPFPIPNGPAGLNLLGTICQRGGRVHQAVMYFRLSLLLESRMWGSYVALCDLGEPPDAYQCFGNTPKSLGSVPRCPPREWMDCMSSAGLESKFVFPQHKEKSYSEMKGKYASLVVIPLTLPSKLRLLPVPGMVESYDLVSPWGLEYKTTVTESNQSLPSVVQRQKSTGVTCSINDRQGIGGILDSESMTLGSATKCFKNHSQHPSSHSPLEHHGKRGVFVATPNLTPIVAPSVSLRPLPPVRPNVQQFTPMMTPMPSKAICGAMWAADGGRRGECSSSEQHVGVDSTWESSAKKMDMITPGQLSNLDSIGGGVSEIASSMHSIEKKGHGVRLSVGGSAVDQESFNELSQVDLGDGGGKTTSDEKPCKVQRHGYGHTPARSQLAAEMATTSSTSQKDDNSPSLFEDIAVKEQIHVRASSSTATKPHPHMLPSPIEGQQYVAPPENDGGKLRKGHGKVGGDELLPGASLHTHKEAMQLLCILATAYRHVSMFECQAAIETLNKIHPVQFNTGWVQNQVGRAYLELGDFEHARQALEHMLRVEPYRMIGLDLLSTTLWHLKRDVDLCYLAQHSAATDKLSSSTWVVIGNCFSLQHETDNALRFFQRGLQLEPSFFYAYTLCGHEYTASEDFDKAMACYRTAIRVNHRHYNAWYGIGAIYQRQEKYHLAEIHYRRALSINPTSIVLLCSLALILRLRNRLNEAQECVELALRLDRYQPQARFERAHILMAQGHDEDALKDLKVVRDAVPKESNVHFLMGKICKKLKRPDEALHHFTIAQDLRPKDSARIRMTLDLIDDPSMDDEREWMVE